MYIYNFKIVLCPLLAMAQFIEGLFRRMYSASAIMVGKSESHCLSIEKFSSEKQGQIAQCAFIAVSLVRC